jgi:hypothetical protein
VQQLQPDDRLEPGCAVDHPAVEQRVGQRADVAEPVDLLDDRLGVAELGDALEEFEPGPGCGALHHQRFAQAEPVRAIVERVDFELQCRFQMKQRALDSRRKVAQN